MCETNRFNFLNDKSYSMHAKEVLHPVSKKFQPPKYTNFTEQGNSKVKFNEAQYELLKFFASQEESKRKSQEGILCTPKQIDR